MAIDDTYLASGQRYMWAEPGLAAWRADRQITIVKVGRGRDRVLRVTYRCPNGREAFGPATELEQAIAAGELVPVMGPGRVGHC